MLVMAGIDVNQYKNSKADKDLSRRYDQSQKLKLHSPMKAGFNDLKQRLRISFTYRDRLKVFLNFALQYRLFFIGVLSLITFIIILIWYIASANTTHRGYEVVYVNSDTNITLTSEEIIYNQLVLDRGIEKTEVNVTLPKIKIINRSGTPGAGAEVQLRLEALGYEVLALEADFSSPQARTVVVYAVANEKDALRLSTRLNNALVSVYDKESEEAEVMTVYVGDDIPAI